MARAAGVPVCPGAALGPGGQAGGGKRQGATEAGRHRDARALRGRHVPREDRFRAQVRGHARQVHGRDVRLGRRLDRLRQRRLPRPLFRQRRARQRQCPLSQQQGWDLHGCDAAGRSTRQGGLQDRRRGRRLRQQRLSRSLRDRIRPQPSLQEQRGRHLHGRHGGGRRRRRRRGVEHEHRLLRLRSRRRSRSLRHQLPRHPGRRQPVLRAAERRLSDVLQPDDLRRDRRTGCFATTGTARSPTCRRRPGSPTRRARGSA